MTEHTPTLPEQLPLGYSRTSLIAALTQARDCIDRAIREEFICLICEGVDMQLRDWVQEAMERNAIRTGGDGFTAHHAPDWIVGAGIDSSNLACNQRRVYFLDRLIEELRRVYFLDRLIHALRRAAPI